MNHLTKITISVLLLLFLGTNLTYSQNEKLWEITIGLNRVTDVDFYDENSFCYLNYELDEFGEIMEDSYKLTIRDIYDTTLIREVNLHPKVSRLGKFEISQEHDLILISAGDKFYYYNYNVELMDSLKVEDIEIDGKDYPGAIMNFTVNFERNLVALCQRLNRIEEGDLYSRVLIYNYLSKELIKKIDYPESIDLSKIEFSKNGNYLAVSQFKYLYEYNPVKAIVYDGLTFEHIANIEDNDFTDTSGADYLSFSPNEKYLAVALDDDEYAYLIYDLEKRLIIAKRFIWGNNVEFLTDEYILQGGYEGYIYSFPGLKGLIQYPPPVAVNPTYNVNNKLILSRWSTRITLSRFDPRLLSVENSEENTTSVYPQPSTGVFNIEFNVEKAKKYSYSIFNETGTQLMNSGKQFYNSGQNQLQVDLSNYPPGIYFLEFQPSIGTTFKLVKE